MLVVETAALGPGCCAFTKTDRGPFIDTLIDDDTLPVGRLYISQASVETMAGMFGMASEQAHNRAKDRAKKLEAELDDLRTKLAKQVELNQALINAGYKEPAHAS